MHPRRAPGQLGPPHHHNRGDGLSPVSCSSSPVGERNVARSRCEGNGSGLPDSRQRQLTRHCHQEQRVWTQTRGYGVGPHRTIASYLCRHVHLDHTVDSAHDGRAEHRRRRMVPSRHRGIGMAQNVIAAGARRKPAALGFPLKEWEVGDKHSNRISKGKVFETIQAAEEVEGGLGLMLCEVFFPGKSLRKAEEE